MICSVLLVNEFWNLEQAGVRSVNSLVIKVLCVVLQHQPMAMYWFHAELIARKIYERIVLSLPALDQISRLQTKVNGFLQCSFVECSSSFA